MAIFRDLSAAAAAVVALHIDRSGLQKKEEKRGCHSGLSLSLCHTLLLLVSFHYLRKGGQEQHGHGQIETNTAHRSNSHVE